MRAGVQPAPLGELKAAAGGDKGLRRGLNAPREWRPPLRRAAGGAVQSAQHHQRICARLARTGTAKGTHSTGNANGPLGPSKRPAYSSSGRPPSKYSPGSGSSSFASQRPTRNHDAWPWARQLERKKETRM